VKKTVFKVKLKFAMQYEVHYFRSHSNVLHLIFDKVCKLLTHYAGRSELGQHGYKFVPVEIILFAFSMLICIQFSNVLWTNLSSNHFESTTFATSGLAYSVITFGYSLFFTKKKRSKIWVKYYLCISANQPRSP
jgi:hypothetical protein